MAAAAACGGLLVSLQLRQPRAISAPQSSQQSFRPRHDRRPPTASSNTQPPVTTHSSQETSNTTGNIPATVAVESPGSEPIVPGSGTSDHNTPRKLCARHSRQRARENDPESLDRRYAHLPPRYVPVLEQRFQYPQSLEKAENLEIGNQYDNKNDRGDDLPDGAAKESAGYELEEDCHLPHAEPDVCDRPLLEDAKMPPRSPGKTSNLAGKGSKPHRLLSRTFWKKMFKRLRRRLVATGSRPEPSSPLAMPMPSPVNNTTLPPRSNIRSKEAGCRC